MVYKGSRMLRYTLKWHGRSSDGGGRRGGLAAVVSETRGRKAHVAVRAGGLKVSRTGLLACRVRQLRDATLAPRVEFNTQLVGALTVAEHSWSSWQVRRPRFCCSCLRC
jgi:hypothetical protein